MSSTKVSVGDYVVCNSNNQYAVILEVSGSKVLLHWGTEYGVKFTGWVEVIDISLASPPK